MSEENGNEFSRPVRVGIGGPVGSGKTMLTLRLCEVLREKYSMVVITNDIYTMEDAQFLARNQALPEDRIMGVETGGCPHTAIRDDTSMNAVAIEQLQARHPDARLVLLESGGDNLSANSISCVMGRNGVGKTTFLSNPTRLRRNVVLPTPFLPITQDIEFAETSRSKPYKTFTSP